MENWFRLEMHDGHIASTEYIEEIISSLKFEGVQKEVIKKVKNWALNSKKDDKYENYGLHIINLGIHPNN